MSIALSQVPITVAVARSKLPKASVGNRRVARWLYSVAAMIFVMVTLGGATRLTGSGLSIMEWAPFRGALPPLSDAEWQRLFAMYRAIPQYNLLNQGFGLEGFQQIFWLEYLHRLWGRLIGLAFALPLLWFWATGQIERRLRLAMFGLLLLGAAQGGVGWLMVASGFDHDAISVSPYRLVVHLCLALTLYAAIVWTALSVSAARYSSRPTSSEIGPAGKYLRHWVVGLCLALGLTIVAGGFVAGTHAGLDYNTFPLMDGQFVPDGYATLRPAWRNLTENVASVQFNHRLLATITALLSLVVCGLGLRDASVPRLPLLALTGLIGLQYVLGVITLLWGVPTGLGTAHQANAVAVLTAALVLLHTLRLPQRRPERS